MKRVVELDGLRGIAALSVVLFHLTNEGAQSLLPTNANFPIRFSFGHYGVQLFFLISGYVITQSLYSKKSLSSFAFSRFIRLFPTFWLCVLFSYLVVTFLYPVAKEVSLSVLLANLSMIPNQFLGVSGYLEGSYWTLEYELYFYIIITACFYVWGKHSILPFFCIVAGIGALWKFFVLDAAIIQLPSPLPSLLYRIYGWFIIENAYLFLCGISVYQIKVENIKYAKLTLLYGLLCGYAGGFAQGLIVTGIAMIFFLHDTSLLSWLLSNKLFTYLGMISYPLYLIHMNFGRSVIHYASLFFASSAIGLALGLLATILLSIVISYGFDIPVRKYLGQKVVAQTPQMFRQKWGFSAYGQNR